MASQNQDNIITFYSRLKKLLKSNTVRYKIPSDRGNSQYNNRIRSTFQKASSNLYLQSLTNSTERLARVRDYEMMDYYELLSASLNIYADCCTMINEDGRVLEIKSSSEKIKSILYDLFYDRMEIDFRIWQITRNILKYGDAFYLLDVLPNKGIVDYMPLPTVEIEREEGYDGDINSVRYKWLQGQGSVFDNFQVAHFRILGDDTFLPYGRSILEPVRKLWKQINLAEDSYLVYYITRAPMRRVFTIDVGGVPPNDIPALMQKAKDILKRKPMVDSNGVIDLRYSANAVEEDLFIPQRGKDGGSKVETLEGATNLEPKLLEYLQAKLFAGLGIPKAYLSYVEDVAGKNVLSQIDVTFSRTISRIQKMIISELNKIAMIHLYSLGIDNADDLTNFKLSLTNSSSVDEMQKLELFAKRFEIYSSATQSVGVDRLWAQKHILKLSDKEIEDINIGINRDVKFKANAEQVAKDIEATNQSAQQDGQQTQSQEKQSAPGQPPFDLIPGSESSASPSSHKSKSAFKNDTDNPLSLDTDIKKVEEDGELFNPADNIFKNDHELQKVLAKYNPMFSKFKKKKDFLANIVTEKSTINNEMVRIFEKIEKHKNINKQNDKT